MSSNNSLVIGPSKVGKTALVASLQHAVLNRPRGEGGVDLKIQAKNHPHLMG